VNVRVLSPALEEIAQAALWFDSQRIGLGDAFWQAVDSLLQRIEENPMAFSRSEFATVELDIRFGIVWRFNFAVHFLVETDEIQIISVAHSSRRPGYWLSHIKKS
jgi:toxin ParE1/3/4